jgi:hypothetical protein
MTDNGASSDPGFATLAREHERRRQLREEVAHAVRTVAGALRRESQLDLLAAELSSRGLDVPPRPFLDVELDDIVHPDERAQQERARRATDFATGFLQDLSTALSDNERHESVHEPSAPQPSRPGKPRHKSPKRKGTQHRPRGGLPMMPDRKRTTEVLLDDESANLVQQYQEPPLPEPPDDVPLLGSMLRLSELAPTGLTLLNFGSLRLRPSKAEGLAVLLAGRKVGIVKDEVAGEFMAHLRGGPSRVRPDAVMGVRYVDREGSVHLWVYLPRLSPDDPRWAQLPLEERSAATPDRHCAFCGLPAGNAVRRTLITVDYGFLRAGPGILLHQQCLPEAQALAEAEGLSLVDRTG